MLLQNIANKANNFNFTLYGYTGSQLFYCNLVQPEISDVTLGKTAAPFVPPLLNMSL